MPETQGHNSLPGILASIVATKRSEVGELALRADAIEATLVIAPPVRDFRAALRRAGTVSLIAECKRRSPGAGEIRPRIDLLELTRGYERAGAAALSVLTDATYFGGSLEDLRAVTGGTRLPVLRKDFILDPLQVVEARGAGADAVLLIVRILSNAALTSLRAEAVGLGMSVLVEVHDAPELERAVQVGADIIGINNRDLANFTTDIGTTLMLLEQVPEEAVIVSESGIRARADVQTLGEAGIDAILVGESLLRASDPGAEARSLCGVEKMSRIRG